MNRIKNKNIIIALLCSITLLLCGILAVPVTHVHADHVIITSDEFADYNVYSALKRAYVTLNNRADTPSIYSDSFVYYSGTTTPIETLDLSGNELTDLSGIENFDMSSIKTLILNNNKLTSIKLDDLLTFTSLEKLYITGNEIAQVDLKNKTLLDTLIANNNKITSIDLTYTTVDMTVDLANNLLTSIDDLSINNTVNYVVNVNNNSITNYTTDAQNLSLDLGVQNWGDGKFLISSDIQYLGLANHTYILKIINKTDNSVTKTLNATDQTIFRLEAGNYVAKFYDGDNLLYDAEDINTWSFEDIDLVVCPNQVTYKIKLGNKEYDTCESTLVGRPSIIVNKVDNTDVYYRIKYGEWIKLGDDGVVSLKAHGGVYDVFFKAVQNGVESEYSVVHMKTSVNPVLPDIVVSVLLIALLLAVAIGGSYLIKKFLVKKY